MRVNAVRKRDRGALRRLDATELGEDRLVVASIVLAGLVLSAALSGTGRPVGIAALAAMSLLWLAVNGPMEGPVLLSISANHGVTGGDLAAVTGLVLAGYRGTQLYRQRQRAGT